MSRQPGRPTFTTVRFLRAGYAVEEVDDFLDELFTAIGSDGPLPDIVNARFTMSLRGYSVEEVDAFLDEVQADLGRDPR